MSAEKKELTNSQEEGISFFAQYLARGNGQVSDANKDTPGIDVFTPFTDKRRVELMNAAKTAMGEGVVTLHAISIKTEDEYGNTDRITCDTFTNLSDMGAGRNNQWWSICMVEYPSTKQARTAVTNMIEYDASLPVFLLKDAIDYIENDNEDPDEQEIIVKARETLAAMMQIKPVGRRGLPTRMNTMPNRFQDKESKLVVMYEPSGAPDNRTALWTNYKVEREMAEQEEAV